MPIVRNIPLTPEQLILLLDVISEKITTHAGPYEGNPEYDALTDLLEIVYLNTRV